jgi:hypothetical protein
MQAFYDQMPDSLKCQTSKEPGLFHRMLIDFIAEMFQLEFIQTLDSLISFHKDGTSLPTTLEERQKQYETETACALTSTIKPTETEERKEVQNFFGYTLSCAKEEIDKTDLIGKQAISRLLAVMTMSLSELLTKNKTEMALYCSRLTLLTIRKNTRDEHAYTFVSEAYFPFGLKLMEFIRKNYNDKAIKTFGTSASRDARERLLSSENLLEAFIAPIPEVVEADLYEDELLWLFGFLLVKTFNSRAGVEVDKFKSENTSRYSRKATENSLRGQLKVLSKRKLK